MKVYICLLKNSATNRIIPPVILGVSETFIGGIDLCINAVPLLTSKYSSKGIESINNSKYINDKDKKRLTENFEKKKSSIGSSVENLMNQNIDTIEKLNLLLEPSFKQIGKARRWCEIIEVEVGAVMPDVAQRLE
jgi:hypothetical protein